MSARPRQSFVPGYPVHGSERALAPDYGRVARALPNAELVDEIALGLGGTGYQEALVHEAGARALALPGKEA